MKLTDNAKMMTYRNSKFINNAFLNNPIVFLTYILMDRNGNEIGMIVQVSFKKGN